MYKHKDHHNYNVVVNNLGASNTERLIEFCFPDLQIKCTYPPKGIDADICAINLRESFEKHNKEYTEETGFVMYKDFDEYMKSLKSFVPYESYEEVGRYINFKYQRKWHANTLKAILNYD